MSESSERYSLSMVPFVAVHLVAIGGVIWLGFSWSGLLLAVALYYFRMFGITAGFHRYFSHRAYKTSRAFQFVLALIGTLSVQKGVLWWAAHHRDHHRDSDTDNDIHSPVLRGFYFSHVGWILCHRYDQTKFDRIRDFGRYPELVWLNKYFLIPQLAFAVLLYLLGGAEALIWGFFVSTAVLWHGTFTINSLAHVFGRKRYVTGDESRNSFALALVTMGEGWHNNHHYYQSTANQGFYWWELDLSYLILRALALLGIVWDLRTPPRWVLEQAPAPASAPIEIELEPTI